MESVEYQLNKWVGSQACIQRNMIPVLIKGFGPLIPDYEENTKLLRAIIELHAIKIDGFNRGLSYDARENVVFPDHPGMPNFTYAEKNGRPIDQFHRTWMRDWLANPHPEINEQARVSVLFFEPNATIDGIEEAYMCDDMYPQHLTGLAPRRDITSAEAAKVCVRYHAATTQGEAVNRLALEVLKSMNLESANPYERNQNKSPQE